MHTKERALPDLATPLRSDALRKLSDDVDVWREYDRWRGTVECRPALVELIRRYRPMLTSLAAKVAHKNAHIGEAADFEQDAMMGAIIAFNRFVPDKASVYGKLYTFVRRTVSMHLLTARDRHSPVGCPSHVRQMRGYFQGRMDRTPEAKATFERAHRLTSDQVREIQEEKVRGLMLEFEPLIWDIDSPELSPATHMEDRTSPSEDDIITRVEIELRRKRLTARQDSIYVRIFEEQLTIPATAADLGLTVGQVRGDLYIIRQTMAEDE